MSLQANMRSVQFVGGLPTAWHGNPVVGPHWEEALRASIQEGADGSRRPAVYRINTRVEADAVLEIQDAGGGGVPKVLRGDLGGFTLQGTVPLTDGIHTVRVSAMFGNAIARHAGDANWRLLLPTPFPVGKTRLEVFSVFNPPADFFTAGVWCEALRLLNVKAGVSGTTTAPQDMTTITNFCHSHHALKYDAHKARNAYGVSKLGGRFCLSAFLTAAYPLVSCFDLLGALVVLGGALGIPTSWLVEDDDFYIKTTDLIGFGPCNNPFFLEENTPQVIAPTDRKRKRFNQHGFCESAATIYDACIGPHLGTVARQGYLDSAVDDVNFNGLGIPPAATICVKLSPITGLV